MIKYYKNIKDYAAQNKICRQTASKRFKNWELSLEVIPKGMKLIEVDKK